MTEYPLQGLIGIRQNRRDDAMRKYSSSKQALEQAVLRFHQKEAELEEYRAWKKAEIERRYDAILGSVQSKNALQKFHAGIANLDVRELSLSDELKDLEEQKEQAKELCAKAKELFNLRQRKQAKPENHKEQWVLVQKLEDEHRAETELEDFKVKDQPFGV